MECRDSIKSAGENLVLVGEQTDPASMFFCPLLFLILFGNIPSRLSLLPLLMFFVKTICHKMKGFCC